MNLNFYDKLTEYIEEKRIYKDEPMRKHTTFRIGGNADYFVVPKTEEEIRNVICLCKEERMPYYILGNGSNLLVSDKGYRGVIIEICKKMNEICVEGNFLKVQAGALLSKVGSAALDAGLAGFEFASGIPGTMGGAVFMNAGAYGGEMKDILTEVTVLDENNEVRVLKKRGVGAWVSDKYCREKRICCTVSESRTEEREPNGDPRKDERTESAKNSKAAA